MYMKDKSLLNTNPHLKDPKKRQQIIETVVVSSSSIEGIHIADEKVLRKIIKTSNTPRQASSSSSKARR